MKIHLLSDIHTESHKGGQLKERLLQPLVRPADVLVLAGDIGNCRADVLGVLEFFAKQYESVIYVAGNHEYYNDLLNLESYNERDFAYRLPVNVDFLNPGKVVINDVTFIGGTLFTNFCEDPMAEEAAKRGINDFQWHSTQEYKRRFYEHSQYFKLCYEGRTTEKVVFVSHFLPDVSLTHPKWRSDRFTMLLNKYYGSDLGDWISELDNATWMFGHTHDPRDELIGTVRCLAAPVGYPGENRDYQHLIHEV